MSEYYETEEGNMSTIEGGEIRRDLVEHMDIGVAEIICIPNSLDDESNPQVGLTLFINATTYDGEKHTLMFREQEVKGFFIATEEYRRLMLERRSKREEGDYTADHFVKEGRELLALIEDMIEKLDDLNDDE